jgi:hypothetical protein
MNDAVKPYFKLQALQTLATAVILGWALTASILLVRNRPQTLLIGMDENGVRVIRDERDDRSGKSDEYKTLGRKSARV